MIHSGHGPHDAAPGLMAAAAGDAEFARELALAFLEDLPGRLAELRAGALAGDVARVRSAAHALRGSAATLGFTDVADRALALETGLPDAAGDPATLATAIEPVTAACDAAERATQAYLQRGADGDSRG